MKITKEEPTFTLELSLIDISAIEKLTGMLSPKSKKELCNLTDDEVKASSKIWEVLDPIMRKYEES